MKDDINVEEILKDPKFLYRRGNIVWIDFPKTEGSIQNGKRKALIYSNDINNIYSSVCHVIPMTTKQKLFKLHLHRNNCKDYFCPEQLQIINKDWIVKDYNFERIEPEQLKMIDELVDVQLGRKDYNSIREKLGRGNKNERH